MSVRQRRRCYIADCRPITLTGKSHRQKVGIWIIGFCCRQPLNTGRICEIANCSFSFLYWSLVYLSILAEERFLFNFNSDFGSGLILSTVVLLFFVYGEWQDFLTTYFQNNLWRTNMVPWPSVDAQIRFFVSPPLFLVVSLRAWALGFFIWKEVERFLTIEIFWCFRRSLSCQCCVHWLLGGILPNIILSMNRLFFSLRLH